MNWLKIGARALNLELVEEVIEGQAIGLEAPADSITFILTSGSTRTFQGSDAELLRVFVRQNSLPLASAVAEGPAPEGFVREGGCQVSEADRREEGR